VKEEFASQDKEQGLPLWVKALWLVSTVALAYRLAVAFGWFG